MIFLPLRKFKDTAQQFEKIVNGETVFEDV